jgi:anaerobic ribonucleoside-triphosphate reductase activating protein
MRICGLQKLALVDYPGKLAATVFTGGCNLRCPFCHNAPLVTHLEQSEDLLPQQVLDFLRGRRGLLDGVVISGGEPLMQDGAADFIRSVRELGFAVKLDTNGCYPDRLQSLLEEKLVDYVAMDIKNCLPKYPLTVGVRDFDTAPVQRSVRLLRDGSVPFEFRTTLVRELHTAADLQAIGAWLEGSPRYFLQTFVDSGNLVGSGMTAFSQEEMRALAQVVQPFFDVVEIRGI